MTDRVLKQYTTLYRNKTQNTLEIPFVLLEFNLIILEGDFLLE